MTYSTEQIIALAPDTASEKAGRSLATFSKWQNLGHDGRALWGECQGSGSKPYQTEIDLNGPAFKCSCPSRKFPCKHALGLFLLFAADQSKFTSTAIPEWVSEWTAKRDQQKERQEAAATKAEVEVDEATLARRELQKTKRAMDRDAKVSSGLQELELWLRDLVRTGLAAAQSRPVNYWNQMVARLIDAQAPGVARRVRELSSLPHSGEGWIERLITQLSSVFLLLKAYERIATLPEATQVDIRTAIGWTYKEEELPEDNLVRDDWLILGQRTTADEGLRVQRTWLWGTSLNRGALILNFAAAGQPLDATLIVGTCINAELLYYPGNYPLRAVVKSREPNTKPLTEISMYRSSNDLLTAYADALARNPWLEAFPAPLNSLVLVRRGDRWFAKDVDQRVLLLNARVDQGWQLNALGGGNPISIFGEWHGRSILPLCVWAEGRHVQL